MPKHPRGEKNVAVSISPCQQLWTHCSVFFLNWFGTSCGTHTSWGDALQRWQSEVAEADSTIKHGFVPGDISRAVIVKADSAAGHILEITPLLWMQPFPWTKSNKKTLISASKRAVTSPSALSWSSPLTGFQHMGGIATKSTRGFSQDLGWSERTRHVSVLVDKRHWLHEQLRYTVPIFKTFPVVNLSSGWNRAGMLTSKHSKILTLLWLLVSTFIVMSSKWLNSNKKNMYHRIFNIYSWS